MPEKRDYLFRYLVSHLNGAGEYSRLFHLLEETPQLSQQADHFDSFAQSLRDLEEQALPAAIKLRDWRRFAHYFLIALNLRGLAGSFMDRETLRVVIEHDRVGFILDVVAGADIDHRLCMRAFAIRRLAREDDRFHALLRQVREDLRALMLPRSEEEAERQFWVLSSVATDVGMEVEAEIRELLTDRPAWADRIWAAVAGGCLERHGIMDSGFWKSLAEIQDEEVLAAVLPDLFADEEVAAPWEALHQAIALEGTDIRVVSLCWAALVGRTAKSAPEDAQIEWNRMVQGGSSVEWSLELVERARDLFAAADAAWIEQAAAQADAPVITAALWVFSAARREAAAQARAEEAIERLPQSSDRIHWTLRLLETLPAADRRNSLQRLTGLLQHLRFAVPLDDLCKFLDFVADDLPHRMKRYLEEIIWAPSVGPEILMTLAEKSEKTALLELLFAKVETYLAAFSPSEVDGYWALKELVPQMTGRLCALRRDLVYLEPALARSPDGDEARRTIAKSLAAAGHRQLAEAVCEGIRSKQLRLWTLFKLAPDSACEKYLKDPATLYSSLAEAEILEDGVLGLMSLLDPSRSLASLHEIFLRRITNENEKVLAGMRRARLALDQPERYRWSVRDAVLGAEGLARAASSLSSDAQLAFLTPDLLEIWARIDPGQACEELRESLSQILGLYALEQKKRCETIEILLSRMHLLLFPPTSDAAPWPRFRDAASLVLWLAGQVAAPPDEAASDGYRDLLPILVAAAARLPQPVLDSLGTGGLLRILEAGRGSDVSKDRRTRLLSRALLEGPREALAQYLAADDAEPLDLVGLIHLLAVLNPEAAIEAIDYLSPNPSRDELCRRLICYGWLPAPQARQALKLIEDSSIRSEAELHLGARNPCGAEEETWVRLLARLATEQSVDSADPRNEILVRHLWSVASDSSNEALAKAARAALASGDTFLTWNAFLLWLHSALSPLPAERSPERLRLASDLLASFSKALRLPSPSATPGTRDSVSEE